MFTSMSGIARVAPVSDSKMSKTEVRSKSVNTAESENAPPAAYDPVKTVVVNLFWNVAETLKLEVFIGELNSISDVKQTSFS